MTREQMAKLMEENFTQLVSLHKKAQKEYTLKDEAFDNFNRLASNLGISREMILWVYLQKHLDGVMNHIKGHQAQREPIYGRIDDCIVYLQILRGMLTENEQDKLKCPTIDFDDTNYKDPFAKAGMPQPIIE